MMKIRTKIYFENATKDDLDELYERFPEIDFFYGDSFLKFHGTPERLQEVIRYAESQALKPIIK